ncbi:hypothetical protein AVEN_171846-1 [Araneus ventricosus]|uniref:Uncharacterized protein n=1 Tax=Araneus ventricosus TaxID=182803 RepID=A0A4Y2F5B0_ARAVE|nr:hypothetical protein AVEN_171846-1 [Araneus ventricosus]
MPSLFTFRTTQPPEFGAMARSETGTLKAAACTRIYWNYRVPGTRIGEFVDSTSPLMSQYHVSDTETTTYSASISLYVPRYYPQALSQNVTQEKLPSGTNPEYLTHALHKYLHTQRLEGGDMTLLLVGGKVEWEDGIERILDIYYEDRKRTFFSASKPNRSIPFGVVCFLSHRFLITCVLCLSMLNWFLFIWE